MNRVTRGEKLLESMVSRGGLTPSGRDFLIAACDPMHDNQLENLMGWPDLESAPSVVRCVKQSLQLTSPSEGGAIVIMTHPCLVKSVMHNCQRANNMLDLGDPVSDNLGNGTLGVCTVAKYDTGQPFHVTTGGVSSVTDVVGLPREFSLGTARLVGLGIEVNDVTAELYKQGTCTVFRLPQPHETPQQYNVLPFNTGVNDNRKSAPMAPSYLATPIVSQQWEKWPNSLENAMLLSGSRQWKACEGAYVVTPFCGQDNPPQSPNYLNYMMKTQSTVSEEFNAVFTDNIVPNTSPVWLSHVNYVEGALRPLIPEPTRIAPIHSTGIILTGLSANSTFTLQVNMFVETFPSIADQQIITLAKPSAQYDPIALELFSQAMGSLPVGVVASANGLGDWFADVVSTWAPKIAPVLSAVHPLLGAGVNLAGNAASSYLAYNRPPAAMSAKQKKEREKIKSNKKGPKNHGDIKLRPLTIKEMEDSWNPGKGNNGKKKK